MLAPDVYIGPAFAYLLPRVLELTDTSHAMAQRACDVGYDGPPFAWDEDRRATLRAELDGWFAHAYGLTPTSCATSSTPPKSLPRTTPPKPFAC